MPAPSGLMKSAIGVRQAELARPDRALRRGAEQPHVGRVVAAGQGREARERVVVGEVVLEVREQLGELLREVVGRHLAAVALQRDHRLAVGAGRAADAEVDALAVQAAEDAERLGDLERAVVRQHHAAAADADVLGRGRHLGDQDLGRRAREHRDAVVLGDPVARVAEPVGEPREVDRVLERIPAGQALGDRRLIEDAEAPQTDCRLNHPPSPNFLCEALPPLRPAAFLRRCRLVMAARAGLSRLRPELDRPPTPPPA